MIQHPKGIKLEARSQGGVIRRPDLKPRSVGHTTETPTGTARAVARQLLYPYHNLVDPITREIFNLVSWDRSALSLRGSSYTGGWETNHAGVRNIQWAVIGYAADMDDLPRGALRWLAEEFLAPMLEINRIPNVWSKSYGAGEGIVLATTSSPVRMGGQEWYNFSGVTYHQIVPGQDHWDMGKIDYKNIMKIIEGTPYNDRESTKPMSIPGMESVIAYGDEGKEVERLEQLLLDYFPTLVGDKFKVNGKFGKPTRFAVRMAQRELGVKPDGYWGPDTARAFRRWKRELAEAVANGIKPDPEKDKIKTLMGRQDRVSDDVLDQLNEIERKFTNLYRLLGNKNHPATEGLLEMIQNAKEDMGRLEKITTNLHKQLDKDDSP